MADDLRARRRADQRPLERFGLGALAQAWLGDFTLALPAVGLIGTWVCYGLAMVLFTAGVQKIPQSLYDAARVDGAGPFREFFAVTLPALRGEIAVALTLTTIAALRNFDLVYITTHGGPGNVDLGAGATWSTTARSRAARSAAAAAVGFMPDGVHLRDLVRDQPARGARRAMTSGASSTWRYVILGVFSLIALVPIVGILFTALQDPDSVAAFGQLGRACTSATSRRLARRATSATTCARA